MKRAIFYSALIISFFLSLSCTLTVENPDIVDVSIQDQQVIDDIDSFHTISISFSMEMNPYITEKNISITGYYGSLHFEWDGRNTGVDIVLAENLELGQRYTLEIGKGCESKDGYDLGRDYRYSFYTYWDTDDFFVVSALPSDGDHVAALDKALVSITFSCPVGYSTLYDKITIDPVVSYNYSFSDNRKVISLVILECLEAHELYTVTISADLTSSGGSTLGEKYTFSFNTCITEEPFSMERAVMVRPGEYPPGMDLDTTYLGRTDGIEKDRDLVVYFSEDFYLHAVDGFINIEPAILYHLEKEKTMLRFVFEENMVPEALYRITFQKSMENIYGIGLATEYSFEWKVNGTDSNFVRLTSVINKDPNGIQDITLYDGEDTFQNEDILYLTDPDDMNKNSVDFEFRFSKEIDVYRSLDKFSLTFLYGGDKSSASGTLTGYAWNQDEKKLTLRFTLSSLLGPGEAFYKLVVTGGTKGVMDREGNYMDESLEIYVKYSFSG